MGLYLTFECEPQGSLTLSRFLIEPSLLLSRIFSIRRNSKNVFVISDFENSLISHIDKLA